MFGSLAARSRARVVPTMRKPLWMASWRTVKTVADGTPGTLEYRLRFKDDSGNDISPWHDIPLQTSEAGVYNALFEIPKNTKPKMEVAVKEPLNPIAQDVKKGKLREYHGPIFWNYGMLPQTWENPDEVHPEMKCAGDNDPVDVVAMIDDGEVDWKVIAIRTGDALAAELNDIADVEAKCPGVVSGIREWFR